jgi:hypothetical protein
MNIPFSAEQLTIIHEQPGPFQMVDPQSGQVYLLVPQKEDYQLSDLYPAMEESLRRNGWGDSSMDIYDRYDEVLKTLKR